MDPGSEIRVFQTADPLFRAAADEDAFLQDGTESFCTIDDIHLVLRLRIHEARHLHQSSRYRDFGGRLTLNGDVAESLCGGVVQLECRMNVHTSSAQARDKISRADTVGFVDGVEEAGVPCL